MNKKFPMLLLHWWLDCQNDAGDKSFQKMKQKNVREIRSFQFGVLALFRNIRNTSVRCKICSKLILKHQNVVIDIVLVFLMYICIKITSSFMVTLVYVLILVYFSLDIPSSLEEQFLQCLV